MRIQKILYCLILIVLFLSFLKVNPAYAATTTVQVTIKASRIIVVDEQDQIKQIWSNTGNTVTEYETIARRKTSDGAIEELTPTIQKQYQELEKTINWEPAGMVYERKEQVFVSFVKQLGNIIKELSA